MKTNTLHFIILITITLCLSCKQKSQATLTQYKYADKNPTISCNIETDDLFKEALYSFENDIINAYDKNGLNKLRAYRTFITYSMTNRVQFDKIISKQTKAVFDVLKTHTNLWDGNHLNYNHNLLSCLTQKMMDKNLKTTFKALVSTNSMSQQIFTPALQSNTSYSNDPYLQTFIALDYFYAKLFQVDFNSVDFEANETNQKAV
ncbi:hypothetical protein PK35_00905 [Tamlana nanhaiensis]|uniref:Uncharacterized protein n=1 Tax=Neotamlana nanhaiensis TaxID=1382798 RepID=A0A0D7W5K3_9FLAO|nr:hypothetical protein [Tamlana nanhaiensis]KJD34395.1 hypothetical protein PK35_00905 [Tamlana nanhaiensis]